jgi:Glycosyl transferases group 1
MLASGVWSSADMATSSLRLSFLLAPLWRAARRQEVDVLHLCLSLKGSAYRKVMAAAVARHYGVPYVVHLHGGGFEYFWLTIGTRVRRAVDRLVLESDKVVVLGQYWVDVFAGWLPQTAGCRMRACGIPVVTTPVAAITEVVEHERNGLLVPVGDIGALANALRRLVENRDLRERLGRAARDDHARAHDIRAYAARLMDLWRDVATRRATTPEARDAKHRAVQGCRGKACRQSSVESRKFIGRLNSRQKKAPTSGAK